MRHNSRPIGYARGHHLLRGHAYADGGDRGLLWARSLRWDRSNKFHPTGSCCTTTTIVGRDGIAIGSESNAACPEILHPRRQQGSARLERGRFGDVLPPWQIEGSLATSWCSMNCAACRPATRACATMRHATRPESACLPDHLRSAAMPERTAKPAENRQPSRLWKQEASIN